MMLILGHGHDKGLAVLAATCTKSGAGAQGKSCRGSCIAVPHSPGTDPLHLALQRMLERNPAAWHSQAQALLALLELLWGSLLQSQPSSHALLPPPSLETSHFGRITPCCVSTVV